MMPSAKSFRRAFTLVELVLSMAVATVLMGGLASAMILASHALPGPQSSLSRTVGAYYTVDQIAGELYCAKSFTERTSTAIEFTVADRNGDAFPETIRYAWSGTAGDPLTRQYNTGTVVAVADDVQEFDLAYSLSTVTQESPPSESGTESAEMLLSSHLATNDGNSFSITSTHWLGQYFQPSLPADALSWKVTRVKFEAQKRGKSDGETLVQLRTADANSLPTSTILEQYSLLESSLVADYFWVEFSFAAVSGLAPTEGACLVLQHVSSATSANVRFDNSSGMDLVETADGGSSWINRSTRAMNHEVYGTVTPSGAGVVATYFLRQVAITLRMGGDASGVVNTAAEILNQPEVPSA